MITNHPYYKDLRKVLDSYMKWPEELWVRSPEAKIKTVSVCASLEAYDGKWPEPQVTLPILNDVATNWPLGLDNHNLTRSHIPTIYQACVHSPTVMETMRKALYKTEAKMLSGEILSTGIAVGLRAFTMLRDLLYRDTNVALNGFGADPTQWGLVEIFAKCVDDYGLLNPHPAAFNHWAWSQRPALVWLIHTCNHYKNLHPFEQDKWNKLYYLPCKMLLPGGKTFTIPNVNDNYGMNPCMGPVSSWVGYTEMDMWARTAARKYESVQTSWLYVPADIGYVPPERPGGCSGTRDFGRVIVSDTEVKYLKDSDWNLFGGHKTGKEVVIKV